MTENDISYLIRGAIFEVYNSLGPGLLESTYDSALTYELELRGLDVKTQISIPIEYKGKLLETSYRLDMLVNDCVIIELKSVQELEKIHFKQLYTYLRLSDKRLGILVNFNCSDIVSNIKRVVNDM